MTATISNPAISALRMNPSDALDIVIPQLRAEFESEATAEARLAPGEGAVARALTVARSFAERADIGPDAADKLAIIVEEWLVNVVEHGALPPGTRIALRLERRGDLIRLAVSDAGQPFDPRDAVFEGPNLERGGGAGLELIRAWSRITGYARRAGRNHLELELPAA
jgi:anti-sigma regulatory factor (Ser/Thr protein kinase)